MNYMKDFTPHVKKKVQKAKYFHSIIMHEL